MNDILVPRSDRSRNATRRGLSLLELLVVVTLMGVFAAAVGSRFSRSIFGDSGARSGARMLSLCILTAQRNAVRTGDVHGIEFAGSPTKISGWTTFRRYPDGSHVTIDQTVALPDECTLTVSDTSVVFDFEGNGTSRFTAKFVGPNRAWSLSVEPLTRMIDSREVAR